MKSDDRIRLEMMNRKSPRVLITFQCSGSGHSYIITLNPLSLTALSWSGSPRIRSLSHEYWAWGLNYLSSIYIKVNFTETVSINYVPNESIDRLCTAWIPVQRYCWLLIITVTVLYHCITRHPVALHIGIVR